MGYFVFIVRGPRGALRIGRTARAQRPAGDACDTGACRKATEQPHRLVYFEVFGTLGEAIQRERQLKAWQRPWKVDLIERVNPRWDDLSRRLMA
jgi:putative endonuclease